MGRGRPGQRPPMGHRPFQNRGVCVHVRRTPHLHRGEGTVGGQVFPHKGDSLVVWPGVEREVAAGDKGQGREPP